MYNYNKRQEAKNKPRQSRGKRNAKPEKETEDQVLEWASLNNMHLHVVDSSTYDPISRQKHAPKVEPGFPDLTGNTSSGHSAWIELKAKGKASYSNCSLDQLLFLEKKIHQNCFAVVVDCPLKLARYWKGFVTKKTIYEKRAFLLDCLPKKRTRRLDSSVDDDEFGF